MRNLFAVPFFLLLSCSNNAPLVASVDPYPASPTLCRCAPYDATLALVRVESEPTARNFMIEAATIGGMLFEVSTVASLPSRDPLSGPVSARFSAFQGLTGPMPGNRPLPGTSADDPTYAPVHRGDLLLVELRGPSQDPSGIRGVRIRAVDPRTGALTRPLFSFPAGTPATQVLSPAEWTCTPETPVLGYCPRATDAG
jgi:hypothetical protein